MEFEVQVLLYSALLIPFSALLALWCMSLFNVNPTPYSRSFALSFESLRGLASVLVLMSHTSMYFYETGNGAGSKASSYLGQSGVIWFFMLTGYLFWSMVLNNRFDLNHFFLKRLRRLVPAMVAMVTAAQLYDWFAASLPVPTIEQGLRILKNYMFAFAGVNEVFTPDMVRKMNVVWTLRWEWLFYLMLPLLAAAVRNWFALTVALILLSVTLTDAPYAWRRETDGALLLAFYLGMSAAILAKQLRERLRGYQTLIDHLASPVVFVLAVAFSVSTILMPADLIRSHNYQFVVFNAPVFIYFVLLNLSNRRDSNIFIRPSLLALGRISYSLYLWHLLVSFFVHDLFSWGILPGLNTTVMYVVMPILVVIISVPLAALSYKYLEQPFMVSKPA